MGRLISLGRQLRPRYRTIVLEFYPYLSLWRAAKQLHLACFAYALLPHLCMTRHGAQSHRIDEPATALGRPICLSNGKAWWRDSQERERLHIDPAEQRRGDRGKKPCH